MVGFLYSYILGDSLLGCRFSVKERVHSSRCLVLTSSDDYSLQSSQLFCKSFHSGRRRRSVLVIRIIFVSNILPLPSFRV